MTYIPKHRAAGLRMPVVGIVENRASPRDCGVVPYEVYLDGEPFDFYITHLSANADGIDEIATVTIEFPVERIVVHRR